MKIHRSNLLAGLWGIAEASIFFIVPDVLLSWIALKSRRRALVACLWVLGGALLGGSAIWFVGRSDPDLTRALFESMPAINGEMIANVRTQLEDRGLWSLFIGPIIGIPFKLYALEAGNLGYGLGIFLLISVPARLIRFVLVSTLVGALSQLLRRRLQLAHVQALLVSCWVIFYAWFFYVMT